MSFPPKEAGLEQGKLLHLRGWASPLPLKDFREKKTEVTPEGGPLPADHSAETQPADSRGQRPLLAGWLSACPADLRLASTPSHVRHTSPTPASRGTRVLTVPVTPACRVEVLPAVMKQEVVG